jgi:hypothetical protein
MGKVWNLSTIHICFLFYVIYKSNLPCMAYYMINVPLFYIICLLSQIAGLHSEPRDEQD